MGVQRPSLQLGVPPTVQTGNSATAENNNANGCVMHITAFIFGSDGTGIQIADCPAVPVMIPGRVGCTTSAMPNDTAFIGLKILWISVDNPPCPPTIFNGTTDIVAG